MNTKLLKLYSDWQILYALLYHNRKFSPHENTLEECRLVILIVNTFNLMVHNLHKRTTTTKAVNRKLLQLGNTIKNFYQLHHVSVVDGNKNHPER
jgi:hypothetical protein